MNLSPMSPPVVYGYVIYLKQICVAFLALRMGLFIMLPLEK